MPGHEQIYDISEKTPKELRADFREIYKNSYRGHLPVPEEGQTTKDATTQVEAYELSVNPTSGSNRGFMQEFGLRAVSAGFEIVGILPFPNAQTEKTGDEIKLNASITYLLKSPKEAPVIPTRTPADIATSSLRRTAREILERPQS